MLTKITTLTLSCLAAIGFSAACAAEGSYNVNQINIPKKPEFMASLGIAKDAKPDLTKRPSSPARHIMKKPISTS